MLVQFDDNNLSTKSAAFMKTVQYIQQLNPTQNLSPFPTTKGEG